MTEIESSYASITTAGNGGVYDSASSNITVTGSSY